MPSEKDFSSQEFHSYLESKYDDFYRGADKTAKILSGASIATHYTYRFDGVSGAEHKRSPVPREIRQTVKNGSSTQTRVSELKYSYDSLGNITKVLEGSTEKARYTYDPLNQLTREDNAWLNKSFTYSYDLGGNITQTKEYAYTTGTLGTATATHSYTYGNANWKDKLTAYDGNTITYDAICNPLNYRGMTFTWENGKQLKSASVGGQTVQFKYDTSGVRIGKTVGSTTWKFTVENGKVLYENNGSIAIRYYYDENGAPFAVYIGSAKYLYEKNLQGDITGLIDENGQLVVSYTYDAWGKMTKTNVAGTTASTSAMANNHLLYRGYYFDSETGLYYLGSRYYDPETGRFINADDVGNLGANGDFASLNLYAYCGNNPVGRVDDDGDIWWPAVEMAVGAAVNVATTYFAAKVTGQEYTVWDGVSAAITGAINSQIHSFAGSIACGVIAAACTYFKTGSIKESLWSGGTTIADSYITIMGTANIDDLIIGVEASATELVSTTMWDLTFGLGEDLTKAGLKRGVIELFWGDSGHSSKKNNPGTISAGAPPVVKPSYIKDISRRNRTAPIAMTV